jgi:hypothetical protein
MHEPNGAPTGVDVDAAADNTTKHPHGFSARF